MIGEPSCFVKFSNSPLYISAEYISKFGSSDLGKVIIQQKDGQKLIIYDVKWLDWQILYYHTQDMEVDELKKNHEFSCK